MRTSIPHAGTQARWLDDGTVVATDGKHVTRWTPRGEPVSAFDLPEDLRAVGHGLAIGAGGHAVVRRGSELVVVQLAATPPKVIARLGLASRAIALAWSADGARLGIATAQGELATWTAARGVAPLAAAHSPVTRLGFDAEGKLAVNPDPASVRRGGAVEAETEATIDELGEPLPGWRLALRRTRLFLRGEGGDVQRFVEAPEDLRKAVRVGALVVAAGESGTLHAWNADTGEGLGAFAPGAPVSALALDRDRRTLAVARDTGGIELWDVGSRTRMLSLVVADARGVVVAPSGDIDGDPRLLGWPAADVVVPGDATRAVQHGLAGSALCDLPPPIAIAPTPALVVAPRGCLPEDFDPRLARPVWAELAASTLSYCVADPGDGDAPYCFAADLTTRAITPIAAPIAVLSPSTATPDEPTTRPTAERDPGSRGVQVCERPGACRILPVRSDDGAELAISDDGALVAVGDRKRIEVWDVATARRLARFEVPAWRGKQSGDRRPLFFGHLVLALHNPCAGPCGHAMMYDARGRELGPFPLEASEANATRFRGDLWIATHGEFGGFSLIDTRTGRVLANAHEQDVVVARSSDRVAAVLGPERTGRVLVYDRAGRLAVQLDTPRCAPDAAAGHR
jgi:hypothetical protein